MESVEGGSDSPVPGRSSGPSTGSSFDSEPRASAPKLMSTCHLVSDAGVAKTGSPVAAAGRREALAGVCWAYAAGSFEALPLALATASGASRALGAHCLATSCTLPYTPIGAATDLRCRFPPPFALAFCFSGAILPRSAGAAGAAGAGAGAGAGCPPD